MPQMNLEFLHQPLEAGEISTSNQTVEDLIKSLTTEVNVTPSGHVDMLSLFQDKPKSMY